MGKKRSRQTGARGTELPGATCRTRRTTLVGRRSTRSTARKIPSSVKEYQSQEQRTTVTQAIQGDSKRASRVSKRFWDQNTRYTHQRFRAHFRKTNSKGRPGRQNSDGNRKTANYSRREDTRANARNEEDGGLRQVARATDTWHRA